MLHRRIYQFLMIYFIGLAALMLVKYSLNLSDYTIPGVNEIWNTYRRYFGLYLMAVLNTLAVAILGHVLSICMATVVGIIGRLTLWIGSFIRVAAYNIQAYPIVAVAPIIFILLGDGLSSRLLIAAMICYFPLLLSFIGILKSVPLKIFTNWLRSSWEAQPWPWSVRLLPSLLRPTPGSDTVSASPCIRAIYQKFWWLFF
jgi:NitT/TauT family transport system permease protein